MFQNKTYLNRILNLTLSSKKAYFIKDGTFIPQILSRYWTARVAEQVQRLLGSQSLFGSNGSVETSSYRHTVYEVGSNAIFNCELCLNPNFLRAYLDEKSKRNINQYLTEGLMQKLTADLEVDARGGNNRPRTPFMSTFVKEFRNEMESYYQKFCEQQATENSMTAESFAMLNPTELLVLLGDGYNPKDYDFDEDKVSC